ncbi:hypothetical protein ACOSP7_019030 [Xanthoceras sorbifolium]
MSNQAAFALKEFTRGHLLSQNKRRSNRAQKDEGAAIRLFQKSLMGSTLKWFTSRSGFNAMLPYASSWGSSYKI